METKTVQMINNICKLDSNVETMVLLKLQEAIDCLYDNIEDVEELERFLERIMRRNEIGSLNNVILTYCGFSTDDDTADEILDEYYDSSNPDRMEILKQQLIRYAIELEKDEQG